MSKRKHNQKFSKMCLNKILSTPNHPLSFLVDKKTQHWRATRHGSEWPSVQVGHLESLHSGAAERLCLEDADFNQMSNWKGERQGSIFSKSCLLIGDIPCEYRTVKMWESLDQLPKGTVAKAPHNTGWYAP